MFLVMYMSFFLTTTLREAKRMDVLREVYEEQLKNLPKGSLRAKERNGKKYYYLSYRCNGKVVSEYIGNDESMIEDLRERLMRRKGVEGLIKGIKKELALMNKVLEVAK